MSAWWRRVRVRLGRAEFARAVGALAGGAALGQLVVVLGSPVLTRLYRPEDFGVLAQYAAIVAVIAVVAALRFEVAIPLPKGDRAALNLLALALATALATAVVTGLVLALVGRRLTGDAGMASATAFAIWVPIGVFATSVYNALQYWGIRTRAFGRIARTKVAQGLASVLTQVLLGLTPAGALGLVAGHVVGQSAGIVTLGRSAWGTARATRARIARARMRAVARRYRQFARVNAPSAVLNALGLAMPPLLLAALYGPQAAGWYALADRAIGAPLGLVTRNVGHVFFGRAAELGRVDGPALRRAYLRVSASLLAIAALPLAAVALYGPDLMAFVFGAEWRPSGEMAQVLSLLYLGKAVASPLSTTLLALERHRVTLVLDTLRAVVTAAAFLGPVQWGASVLSAVTTYGVAMFAMYALTWTVTLSATRRPVPTSGASRP